ncbi:MAG TPA: hypothetical protein PL018_10285 [Ignavibacteriaceae bacterium]|nr:hypothetical protein [Ignavibacteriaceae bacterium]HRP93012.1 hypothetical protein [Ignavibacteriaceae bacterium]HRQ54633.1 hypothetical protein [Ignavibacteriaceae bacterium]
MNKPKFSLAKTQRVVEISSKIEGHKIPSKKRTDRKKVKANVRS